MASSSIGDVVRVSAPWVSCWDPSEVGKTGHRWTPQAFESRRKEGVVRMHKRGMMRVGLWTCMVVIVWGLGLAETAHAQKVGIVDLQAVLDQSTRGRSAKDRLRELGDRLQQEIKSK